MNKTRTCSESTIKNGKKEDLIYLLLARNQGNESIFISVGGRKVFGIKNSIWKGLIYERCQHAWYWFQNICSVGLRNLVSVRERNELHSLYRPGI